MVQLQERPLQERAGLSRLHCSFKNGSRAMLSFSKGRYRGSFEFHNKLIETNLCFLLRVGDSYLGRDGGRRSRVFLVVDGAWDTCDHLSFCLGQETAASWGWHWGEGMLASSKGEYCLNLSGRFQICKTGAYLIRHRGAGAQGLQSNPITVTSASSASPPPLCPLPHLCLDSCLSEQLAGGPVPSNTMSLPSATLPLVWWLWMVDGGGLL